LYDTVRVCSCIYVYWRLSEEIVVRVKRVARTLFEGVAATRGEKKNDFNEFKSKSLTIKYTYIHSSFEPSRRRRRRTANAYNCRYARLDFQTRVFGIFSPGIVPTFLCTSVVRITRVVEIIVTNPDSPGRQIES